jgi:alpha-methylacyl-CoA racemase
VDRRGPLTEVRLIEMGGIGPTPFCGMLLADMGADVIRIDRPSNVGHTNGPHGMPWTADVTLRGRRSIALDLKQPTAVSAALGLVSRADGLIEGFRPGVMERLGLGPEVCRSVNRKLVFGRMTGWGQDGPLASRPRHDINFVAFAGALAHFGQSGPPLPLLNLLGDYGAGAMFLAFGMACGLFEASSPGEGQIIDAAITDGVAVLMSLWHGKVATGGFDPSRRGVNIIDGEAPWMNVYECADGRYITVGASDSEFYAELRRLLGLAGDPLFDDPGDKMRWPRARQRLVEIFGSRTSIEWSAMLEDQDACFAAVLALDQAPQHRQNIAREAFVDAYGVRQPKPASRFSRTGCGVGRPPAMPGQHTNEVLAEWAELSQAQIAALNGCGAAIQP